MLRFAAASLPVTSPTARGKLYRAAIVGAGYIGVEAADALRRHGLRVRVYERSKHALLRDDQPFTDAVHKLLD